MGGGLTINEVIEQFQRGTSGSMPAPAGLGRSILALVASLTDGQYRPVASLDDDGMLSVELRLSPEEQLLLEVHPSGQAEAVVHSYGAGFETIRANDIPGIRKALSRKSKLKRAGSHVARAR